MIIIVCPRGVSAGAASDPLEFSPPAQVTKYSWLGRFGPKVDQIDPKWDKSGTFPVQFTVHLEQSRIWSQSDALWGKI